MIRKFLSSTKYKLFHCVSLKQFQRNCTSLKDFKPRNVVILSKLTRYEYEKLKHPGLCEEDFKQLLRERGSDYHGLKQRHLRHEEIRDHVQKKLHEKGIASTVVSRQNFSSESLNGADLLISAGGDGTFLLGSSKIHNDSLPILGVNTDPERSEGYLCLSRAYSLNFGRALDKILTGDFSWLLRKRIRITMSGKHANDEPVQLLEQQLNSPEHRFSEHVRENELHSHRSYIAKDQPTRILPVLALNDVFIGESLSARVSYYELAIDGSPKVMQKSSGITICTGTGSSSWHFNINSIQTPDIRQILKIAKDETGIDIPYDDAELAKTIYTRFNKSLFFSPVVSKMAFTVRDPIHSGIYRVSEPRGFAQKIEIRSKMWDACLVIDGGVTFQFNDGAEATLEILEEDMLRNIVIS